MGYPGTHFVVKKVLVNVVHPAAKPFMGFQQAVDNNISVVRVLKSYI
jgi:hypothetical protein